jgi:EamA domain-containing membrane protein RarD
MLNRLIGRIIAGLIAAGLAAGAAGVAVIAAGFGLYDLLRHWLSAPAAGGATALVFALLTVLIALVAPAILKRRPRKAAVGLKLDGATARTALESGIAILAAVLELRAARSSLKSKGRQARRGK